MKNGFNPYNNQNNRQYRAPSEPQYRIPTWRDFAKLFTKFDIFAIFLIAIVDLLHISPIISSMVKSFASGVIFMPKFILLMRKLQKNGQPIRENGPESHLSKKNTPTMGGVVIVVFCCILSAIYCNTHFVYVPILTLIFYGILGFYDDFLKLKKNNSKGISKSQKFLVQTVLAIFFSFLIYSQNHDVINIYLPFFGLINITIWGFIPLGTITIISSSNAFNLTDGLDGLAITQYLTIVTFFTCVALGLTHHAEFVNSMFYNVEMAKFMAVTLGVSASFLCLNSFPAKIFMGDVGSLALGALIGVIALMFAMPLVLVIAGIVMVAEVISVIIQVYFFKKSGGKRRFFLMTPIHHHFEKLGFHENRITQTMFVITVIFSLIASQL